MRPEDTHQPFSEAASRPPGPAGRALERSGRASWTTGTEGAGGGGGGGEEEQRDLGSCQMAGGWFCGFLLPGEGGRSPRGLDL